MGEFFEYVLPWGDKFPTNQLWGAIGGAELWEDTVGNPNDWGTGMAGWLQPSKGDGYDMSTYGTASTKEADTTGIPAVAQSVSSDSAKAVEAQDLARQRARGILSTYTRYTKAQQPDTSGKMKLGE